MEKKKLQQVIGVLVVVALIVAFIPLLFNKKDLPPHEATALASQPEQLASASNTSQKADIQQNNANNSINEVKTTQPVHSTQEEMVMQENGITPINASAGQAPQTATTTATPVNPATTPNSNSASLPTAAPTKNITTINSAINSTNAPISTTVTPSNTTHDAQPTALANPLVAVDAPAKATTVVATPVTSAQEKSTPAIKTPAHPEVKTEKTTAANVPVIKKVKSHETHANFASKKASEKNIPNLNKQAWVVQMGSFKDKLNANRLADQLRMAGYKAFTRETVLSTGIARTQVYIGPEFKEASALKLSTQVEHDMKLKGFVTHYKPLAL